LIGGTMGNKNVDGRYLCTLQVLEGYLSNNYSYEKLASNLSIPLFSVQKILGYEADYIKAYFGNCVYDGIQEHKQIMKRYQAVHNHTYVLDCIHMQLRTLLRNPNDLTLSLNSFQVRALTALRLCYVTNGNLSQVAQLLNISLDSLITYLSSSFLQDIISDNAREFLNQVLSYAFLYMETNPKVRRDYLVFLFERFALVNGNLKRLSRDTNLPIPVLRDILADFRKFLLSGRKFEEHEWILQKLEEQSQLSDDLLTDVEEHILLNRHNMYETYKDLNIRNYKVKKLVREDIPQRNPVRGLLVQGVLSTLNS